MTFEITSSEVLEKIPSASGIVLAGDRYFVVGDDSPFMFELDQSLKQVNKIQIYSVDQVQGDRITKKHKPDFEAMEKVNEQEIAIFGSGSKSPERDYFVRVLLNRNRPEVKLHQITSFYNHLQGLKEFQNTELNIEAAAEYKGDLFLFNRRKNLIIRFNYSEFVGHIENKSPLPKIQITEVELPKKNGIEAGFSGATAFEDKPLLIFTASVEDTDNAYDDGDILGSFIGILDMETGKIQGEVLPIYSPDKKDEPVKVESVAIIEQISEKELDLILTTDSDGGTSLIMRGRLSL